jgi:glucose-6-phosphate dehydrogenase assembly protein OpcA
VAADLEGSSTAGPGFRHIVWTARGTTPAEVEAALRRLLIEGQTQYAGYAPARALNMVCVVEKAASAEVAVRLRGAGRYLASRTVMCTVEAERDRIDATCEISSDVSPGPGEFALLREMVTLEVGERHLSRLDPIVDPLVVTDIPTVLWSPSRYEEAVRALMPLSQVVLLDSVEDADLAKGLHRACEILESAYVVDLAWLRTTPWRERVAATFDPPHLRPDLHAISGVTVRIHPESAAAGLLLVGWLASRLGWKLNKLAPRDGGLAGSARAGREDIEVSIERAPQEVRGLAGLTLETATGRRLSLDRGPGGLKARYVNDRGDERQWTVLGASRGEGGILGEGIRQALLRDPTYGPAVSAASQLV